jgi:hypothetical protein
LFSKLISLSKKTLINFFQKFNIQKNTVTNVSYIRLLICSTPLQVHWDMGIN